MNTTEEKEIILELLKSINSAWLNGAFEKLESFFHEEMVIAGPDFQPLSQGRQSSIDSFRTFMSQVIVHSFKENPPVIHVWNKSAIAGYSFEIDYEVGGKRYHETGRDFYLFTNDGTGWKATWRMVR